MSVYYKHERSEDIDILYNFKCEQCGEDSGDLLAHVVGEKAIYNSNFKNINDDRNKKLCAEAHKNLVDKLKEIYNNANEKDIFSSEFKDVCPHCKARQSWSVSGLKQKLLDMPKIIFIVGVIITIVALIAHYNSDLEYLTMNVVYGIAGTSVIATVASFAFNMVRLKIRQSKVSGNIDNDKPNIDWKNVGKLLNEE